MSYKIGQEFKNNQGCVFKIISIVDDEHVEIEWQDKFKFKVIIPTKTILKPSNKNPYHPTVFSKGYLGDYKKSCDSNIDKLKSYKIWKHMLERTYDPNYHAKFPTYRKVSLSEEWHDFSIFKSWFDKNYIEGYSLDKDLLQMDVENRVYSKETCIFIPTFLNSFLASYTDNPNNTSGVKGVSWNAPRKKWMVTIFDIDRRVNVNLGRYSDLNEAKIVYNEARNKKAEVLKDKMRNLNYLPEHIIQLIK